MFYQFVQHGHNETLDDGNFIGRVLKDKSYVTINNTLNIVLFIVCTFGIAVNVATIMILCRLGLKKRSNVLIVCLATADAVYLLGITNIPIQIYIRDPENYCFCVTHDLAFFLYLLFHCAVFLENVGKVASLILPVLIALERIVAVFFPLQFTRIVRLDLLRALVVLVFLSGVPVYANFSMLVKFAYKNDVMLNETVGLMLRSDDYANALERYRVMVEVYITFCGPVCTGIVILACIAVGVKVHIQMKERRRLLGAWKQQELNLKPNVSKTLSSSSSNTNDEIEFQKPDSLIKDKGTHIRLSPRMSKPPLEEMSKKVYIPLADCAILSFASNSSESSQMCARDSSLKLMQKVTKTTKILISVCAFYSLNGLYGFLSVYIVRSVVPSVVAGVVIHRISILIMGLNSIVNFFIYVFLNPNFRKQYKYIFCRSRRN